MSERSPHKTNSARSFLFMVFDGTTPKTGLTNSDFTKKLLKNQAHVASPSITVSEVDSSNQPGVYKGTYTPDADGEWDAFVYESTYGTYGQDTIYSKGRDLWDPQGLGEAVLVATVDGTGNIESSYAKATLLDVIQRLCNKVTRSGSSSITFTKKDDSTVWVTENITTDASLLPVASADPT